MPDWIFTPLHRGWPLATDGKAADEALIAQVHTDAKAFLRDNADRLASHYGLTRARIFVPDK